MATIVIVEFDPEEYYGSKLEWRINNDRADLIFADFNKNIDKAIVQDRYIRFTPLFTSDGGGVKYYFISNKEHNVIIVTIDKNKAADFEQMLYDLSVRSDVPLEEFLRSNIWEL